jgi:hypothetical protein
MGGSTRLLLNLAQYLQNTHQVSVALEKSTTPESSRRMMEQFPDVKTIPVSPDFLNKQNFDLAVLHLPFSFAPATKIKAGRKLAVVMELMKKHKPTIDESKVNLFHKIIYLHPEQVAHFSEETRKNCCKYLEPINNIDFEFEFTRTKFVACIGGVEKCSMKTALSLLQVLPEDFGLRRWSAYNIPFEPPPLTKQVVAKIPGYIKSGRLQLLKAEGNINEIAGQYDVLFHAPVAGNGTSIVISDALNCGKLVILSPIPEYKRAYSNMKGVLFIDQPARELVSAICAYSKQDFLEIKSGYKKIYDRESVLKQWESTITK